MASQSGSSPPSPIIYFNIGWMKKYAGPLPNDRTYGAHGYLADHFHGAECYNFIPTSGGRLRGYRPGHARGVNLRRIGGDHGAATLDGVLVIWIAREPSTKRAYIVGWYRNATIFREAQGCRRHVNGERIKYTVEASPRDAILLPPIARDFEVPSHKAVKGGFGQSPIWYGMDRFNKRVEEYVQTVTDRTAAARRSKGVKKPPRNTDPELRRRVEQAAVDHAWSFFESEVGGGYDVETYELEARGWDLEATRGDETLLIEVKGLSGPQLVCELTPNEYEKMRDPKYRDRYIIYVLCNAMEPSPIPSVFRRDKAGDWRAADGRLLVHTPKEGAVLSCR